MEFEDKILRIFEAVEDEENVDVYDDLYKDEDAEEEEKQEKLMKKIGAEDEEDYSEHADWTGIPNPSRGKTLDDMKALKVMGPPGIWYDGEWQPADPSLEMEDGEFVNPKKKDGTRFQGGRVTPKIWNDFTDSVRSRYVPVNSSGDVVDIDDLLVDGDLPVHQVKGKWAVKYPSDWTEEKIDTDGVSHFERRSRDTKNTEFLVPQNVDEKDLASGNFEPWTFNDVVSALKPYALSMARKFSTPTYSMQEAFTDAMSGISQAWLTDLGKSPFHNHAYETMVASVKDAATRARNVSGENISASSDGKKGIRQWASAYKGAVSADAPVGGSDGEGESTLSASFHKEITSEDDVIKNQKKLRELIMGLTSLEDVGLSPKERNVLLLSYGIDPKTGEQVEWTDAEGNKQTGPVPLSFLASRNKPEPVSNVRMTQIRNNAMTKLKGYLDEIGASDVESALRIFKLEESVLRHLFETIVELAKVEIDMLSESKIVDMVANINGFDRKVTVNISNMDVLDVVFEGDSVYGQVDSSVINEAKMIAKAMSKPTYFAEMANMIIKMQAQPILAIIGANAENEISEYDEKEDCDS